MFTPYKNRIDVIRYKIERLRYEWKDMLYADLATRVTKRFPKAAYWITLNVGVRNIYDNEVVPDVPFMNVLNRQFIRTKLLNGE